MLIHFLYFLWVIDLRPQDILSCRRKAFSVSQLGLEAGKSIHIYMQVRYLSDYGWASVVVDRLLVVIFLKLKEGFQRQY